MNIAQYPTAVPDTFNCRYESGGIRVRQRRPTVVVAQQAQDQDPAQQPSLSCSRSHTLTTTRTPWTLFQRCRMPPGGRTSTYAVLLADVAVSDSGPMQLNRSGTFRFWIDEVVLPGRGRLVERALLEAGGTRTGCLASDNGDASPHAQPDPAVLGHNHMEEWDVLWSTHHLAIAAVLHLKASQVVNAMPGMNAITDRHKLSATLVEVYGHEQAFDMMPPTFAVPQQLDDWLRWLRRADQPEENPDDTPGPLWLLKGRLLQSVPADSAIRAVEKLRENRGRCPTLLAQQMVCAPLLLDGRTFHLQLWILVTGTDPLRAYLHRNGLAYFSSERLDAAAPVVSEDGRLPGGRATSDASAGIVWNLYQLERALGVQRFGELWARIQQTCARVVAAALGPVASRQRQLGVPPSTTFHLLGAKFLVDEACHPWLLKVQGSPSLDVRHRNPGLMALINDQKSRLAKDCVTIALRRMAGLSGETVQAVAEGRRLDSGIALAERELQALGGFQPLMKLFPIDARQRGARIPWQRVDHAFQAMLAEM